MQKLIPIWKIYAYNGIYVCTVVRYDGRFFFYFAIILNVSGMLILLFPFSNFKIENCHGDVWLTFKSMRIFSIIPYSTLSKSIKLFETRIGIVTDRNK